MTLIEAHENGVLVGRCDERCYGAKGGDCHCVCQGANHGVGRKQALVNTQGQAEGWKRAERKKRAGKQVHFRCPPLEQPGLWEG